MKIKEFIKKGILAIFIWGMGFQVGHAQDFGVPAASANGTDLISPASKMMILIGLRYVFVLGLVICGMIAFTSGYHWLNSEGNTKKGYENKRRLALCLLIITGIFFAMVLYKAFIPDYSVLAM